MVTYAPERGDIIWIDFSPHSGHEQANRRPALVLSPKAYNRKTNLALLCPVTSKAKGYSFEVKIPDNEQQVSGVILADQVRSFDWKSRNAKYICQLPDIAKDVIAKLKTLLT